MGTRPKSSTDGSIDRESPGHSPKRNLPSVDLHVFRASYGNRDYCAVCGELKGTHPAVSLCPGYKRSDYGNRDCCKYCGHLKSEHIN